MEEPSIKEQRIDGDEVEAEPVAVKVIDDNAKMKELERIEEERAAKLTVRLKGIPFEDIAEADIAAFFPDCEIVEQGIFIAPLTRVAYVEFKDDVSFKKGVSKSHSLQSQGITLTRSRPFHRTKDIAVSAGASQLSKSAFSEDSFPIHLRFLPYWTTEDRVIDFYKDFEVLAIHMVWDHIGRSGSQCYVEFNSEEDRTKALQMKGLGRHVKFAKSNITRLNKMLEVTNHNADSSSFVVKLLNLPTDTTEDDIRTFFKENEDDLTGIYVARDWLDKGAGVGFVTVARQELERTLCTKSGTITASKETNEIKVFSSCVTELSSTLASCYTREKNSFNRGYGRGRGGYQDAYRYNSNGRRGQNRKKNNAKSRNTKKNENKQKEKKPLEKKEIPVVEGQIGK